MNKIIYLLIFTNVLISANTFDQKYFTPNGASFGNNYQAIKTIDYDKDGNYSFVLDAGRKVLFFEYTEDYNFTLRDSFISLEILILNDIGDLDGDGLFEMLIGIVAHKKIYLYEQMNSFSFFDNLVWQSDTIYGSIYHLGITNRLKGDGVDRIYGAGIPWLSSSTKGYGWYYFTCTGDNQYEILNTFEESTYCSSNMDIGNLDNDSLTDVVIPMYGDVKYFESVSTDDDSFEFISSKPVDGGIPLSTLILPDIDRDGRNEYIQYCVNYVDLSGYVSYGYAMMEDTSDSGVYDTIWRRDFNSVTDYIYVNGGDIDYGDIDGDSVNELVICGGRHIEVWEATGDNQFERMWEWTDPTYYTIQSHIKCHDFNKNGIDEIIFSGCGEGVGEECTRIFECDTTREPSAPEMLTAEANDGVIIEEGVDYDDYIRIEFEGLTNEPNINKSNIDSILKLSGGHSYLANGKYLDTCRWEIEEARSVLYIELTQIQAEPTVAVDDTIYPDEVTIRSFEYPVYAVVKPIVITGNFGPEGTGERHEPCAVGHELQIQMQSQYIIWNTNTQGTLTVYDISGREVIREESKASGTHKTDIRHLKNGIYFIKLKTENQSIAEKLVRIR